VQAIGWATTAAATAAAAAAAARLKADEAQFEATFEEMEANAEHRVLTGSFMKPSRKLKRVLLQKWVFFACDPGHDASKDQMLRLDTATGAELTGKKKDELDIKGADGKTVHNVKLSSAADACKWLAAVENNIAARRALPSHLAASAAAKPPLAATAVAVARSVKTISSTEACARADGSAGAAAQAAANKDSLARGFVDFVGGSLGTKNGSFERLYKSEGALTAQKGWQPVSLFLENGSLYITQVLDVASSCRVVVVVVVVVAVNYAGTSAVQHLRQSCQRRNTHTGRTLHHCTLSLLSEVHPTPPPHRP
jgi:hypothetical protein